MEIGRDEINCSIQSQTPLKYLPVSVVLNSEPMSVKVLIPTPLQKFVGDQAALDCEAGSINDLIEVLEGQHPGIKARLCDESGKLRRFVNFYLNSEDIRFMENEETVLNDGDEVSIVPAIAGG